MREVKFRFFKNGQMNYNPELIFNENVCLNEQIEEFLEEGDLMQFTGLKDSKNKEIYEGDILKVERRLYFISFKEGSFIGINKDDGKISEPILYFLINYPSKVESEVIGNVFENPEFFEFSK